MAPLSQLQNSMEQTTTMKPQHCTTEVACFTNQQITSACFSLGAWQDEALSNNGDHDENLPFAFPECRDPTSWDDDDGSQSCEWSVASSDTSVSWYDEDEENEEDEALSKELDDYLNLCLQKQYDERPRVVNFSDTTHVQTFVKVSAEHHSDMYYTAHELQRMMDDFAAEGGTKLLG